jgi:parvulin-like peptidyl-prolyl isomerase
MKQFKRILCGLLSALMLMGMLSGCTSASDPDTVILTVGDREFKGLEYSYYFNSNKRSYDDGDDSYWDGHEDEVGSLKDVVLRDLKEISAVDALAKKNNISLTQEEKDQITEDIENTAKTYGDSDLYDKYLLSMDMNRTILQKLQEDYLVQNKLLVALYGDELLPQIDMSKVLHAKHILIKYTDEEAETHEEELAKATEVMEKAKAGEDFDELIAEYNEDPGMITNPDGYYFVEGEMVDEFYEGTLNLKENEISEPIATDYGYHVILRLPVEEDYVNQYLLDNIRSLLSDEQLQEYSDLVTAEVENLSIEYSDVYDDIKFTTYADTAKDTAE